jgi:hypothetical protein
MLTQGYRLAGPKLRPTIRIAINDQVAACRVGFTPNYVVEMDIF